MDHFLGEGVGVVHHAAHHGAAENEHGVAHGGAARSFGAGRKRVPIGTQTMPGFFTSPVTVKNLCVTGLPSRAWATDTSVPTLATTAPP